jgi:uncharacterized protein
MLVHATDTQMAQLLRECKTIAVVGLSDNPLRPSFTTALYMQQQGYRIVPVNPARSEILGETCYPSLRDIPFAVDIVNVFRRSEEVLPIAQQALEIGARCLWQQIGVAHLESAALFEQAGRLSVMNRCVKIEHMRLLKTLTYS